jgi:hypothetical protein
MTEWFFSFAYLLPAVIIIDTFRLPGSMYDLCYLTALIKGTQNRLLSTMASSMEAWAIMGALALPDYLSRIKSGQWISSVPAADGPVFLYLL